MDDVDDNVETVQGAVTTVKSSVDDVETDIASAHSAVNNTFLAVGSV